MFCDDLREGGWEGGREAPEGKDLCIHTATCAQNTCMGFPGGADGEESACRSGDPGLVPGSGRSPGEGNGNPLQCSCLENPMDRGAWRATVHGVSKS